MSCGLRDVLEFESLGRPAVLIASDAFERGAEEQAQLLGQPDLRRVFVRHPVQDLGRRHRHGSTLLVTGAEPISPAAHPPKTIENSPASPPP